MERIWVIEMLIDKKWETTIGVRLTKEDAKMFMRADWMHNMPDDKFRVRKYVPETTPQTPDSEKTGEN